jgi:peroxiredoxin Q/BCP
LFASVLTTDPISAQTTFAETNNLPFPLLADTEGKAAKAYGVGKGLMGLVPERKTIFIGPDGVVRNVYVANIEFWSHTNFVAQELEKLNAEAKRRAPAA